MWQGRFVKALRFVVSQVCARHVNMWRVGVGRGCRCVARRVGTVLVKHL